MGLVRRIAEERQREIVAHAKPHVDDDEEVLVWVRARKVEGRGKGFVYITASRCVVSWPGKEEDDVAVPWTQVTDWGVRSGTRGGPVLGFEHPDGLLYVKLPVATSGMAQNVSNFFRRFAVHAPTARRELADRDGALDSGEDVEVMAERRSLAGQTQRILLTILGILMIVGGVAITWIPGPWSFPVIIGGLAVLAREYDWAEDALQWAKQKYRATVRRIKQRRRRAQANDR